MFAIVRTGGKQYRVAAGDKIAVEKIPGEAGDSISLGEVLLAGDGGELKAAKDVIVSAEIIAQAKTEKVIVFKKRRRHNYRRKNGHRQQMTILKILGVGSEKVKAAPKKAEAKPEVPKAEKVEAAKPEAKAAAPKAEKAAAPKAAKPAAEKKAAEPKAEKAEKPASEKKPAAAKKPAAKKKDA